ncbi:MAG: SUMF1/EgtB/PvdO family nonheme iron enzyme [Nitrospira sp.]|nr:SUMF1/EgtB/PvdO family nonheme iron enzyme [Nitrospira sp.]
MSKILISYRREDSIDVTGRIHDRLVKDFGPGAVFMDVDSIPYGVDFRTYLDEQVSQCEVFLAVIGRDWLRGKERKGKSRLEDPADFVRIEIESALKRGIPVIPVLVGGASVPPVQQLPASIQDLSYRHAIVIRPNPDFHRGMDRLIDYLRTQLDRENEQIVSPIAQGVVSDVRGTEEAEYSDADRFGGAGDEIKVRPSGSDSEAQAVKLEQKEQASSLVDSLVTTEGVSPHVLGGIGLLVLIGAVTAFLILQPKPSPVYSPPVVEKKEEQQAQVTPPLSSPNPAEPVAVPRKQSAPMEKPLAAIKPPKNAEKKEEPVGSALQPAFPKSSEPVAVSQKQDAHVEKLVTAKRAPIPNPEMIRVSVAAFTMRTERDFTGHEVRFAKPFAMARYETTFDEYDRFAQATERRLPQDSDWGRGLRPVINVSWDDANAYAQWLSEQTGKRYRLPTEAEWEYAARSGGKNETWAGTSDEDQLKNYAVYAIYRTEPVGSKKPNELGFYDMSGNVFEWVEDCWHNNYLGAPTDGSAWLEADSGKCGQRVLRGGSWNIGQVDLRASLRFRDSADVRLNYIGFRLVQDIP